MEKVKLERIVKTFYDKLEEGKIVGRKCTRCGHVEFPPYLMCNMCGCTKTEWIEMSGKGQVIGLFPQSSVHSEPELDEEYGGMMYAIVQTDEQEEVDAMTTVLLGVGEDRYQELRAKIPFRVEAVIAQRDGFKYPFWKLADE